MSASSLSPYLPFTAEQWGRLRASTELSLGEDDLEQLSGLNVDLSLDEVTQIYLPLSRLLNLYVGASQELYRASDTFLGLRHDTSSTTHGEYHCLEDSKCWWLGAFEDF